MKATPQLFVFLLCFGLSQAGAAAQPAAEPVVLETSQLRFSLTPENGELIKRSDASMFHLKWALRVGLSD